MREAQFGWHSAAAIETTHISCWTISILPPNISDPLLVRATPDLYTLPRRRCCSVHAVLIKARQNCKQTEILAGTHPR